MDQVNEKMRARLRYRSSMVAEFVPLRPGDPIGVVALSGPVDRERLNRGLEELRRWDHPLLLAGNLGSAYGYLAGSDDERLGGLRTLLERGARVLVGARGGYGSTRILAEIPWSELVEAEVRLVGFSDLTAVMLPLLDAGGVVQVHGPMVAAGLDVRRNADRLHKVLTGELMGRPLFRFQPRSVVRPGRVQGPAIGGNLSLLTSLLGTPYQPNLDGCVLFLEEVDEPVYRLDRMLTHLSASGTLRRVKALMSGSLRGCRPAPQRAARWRQLIEECAPPGAAAVVDLPFGHSAANLAFPLGATVEVDTDAGAVIWSG